MRHLLPLLILAALLSSCATTKTTKTAETSVLLSNKDSSSTVVTSKAETAKQTTITTTEKATTTATIQPAVIQREVRPDSAQTFESNDLQVTILPQPNGRLSVTAFRKPVDVPVQVDKVTTVQSNETATEAKSEAQTAVQESVQDEHSEVKEIEKQSFPDSLLKPLFMLGLLALLFFAYKARQS